MARGTQLSVWLSLQNDPLGNKSGENFSVPMNYREPPARIFVRNWSRTQERKDLKVAVSERRGAEEALIFDKELAQIYNVDTLTKRVEQGRDMNRYETHIKPIIFALKVGGRTYAIPPAKTAESEPPKVEVKEGAWDLFLGNYERMRGIVRDHNGEVKREADQAIMGEEKSRLALFWSRRWNPVMSFTDDGVTTSRENPFGYLEFIRETIVPMAEVLDKEYLSALDLVEV